MAKKRLNRKRRARPPRPKPVQAAPSRTIELYDIDLRDPDYQSTGHGQMGFRRWPMRTVVIHPQTPNSEPVLQPRGRRPDYERAKVRNVAEGLEKEHKAKGHTDSTLAMFARHVAWECGRQHVHVSRPDKQGRYPHLERIVRDIYLRVKELIRVAGLK